LGPIHPRPRHQSWEVPVPQRLLFHRKGEQWAIKELADRIDGKVPQAQIIQGDEDGGAVRYYAEVPRVAESTEAWVEGNPVKHTKADTTH